METYPPNTSPPQPKRPRLSDPTDPTMAGQPPPPGEQWQNLVRQDARDHLIKRILNGIYPVNDYNTAMTNPQYSQLAQVIQQLEDHFFRRCISKDEYFAQVADRYLHIVKELQRMYPGHAGMNPMVPGNTQQAMEFLTQANSPCLGQPKTQAVGQVPKDPKEAQNRAIQRFIQVLVHAAQCRDKSCKSPTCAKMKRIMFHVRGCKQCGVCKQFLSLWAQHAKTCKSSNCPVPLCANLKKHILEKQRQTCAQENRFAARRMLAMRSAMPTTSSSLGSSSKGATVQSPPPGTPLRQQPSTPQQPPQQVTNSPAPSPAVVCNPPSIPPPSVSHQSPGGKALGALQQNQEAQQPHGDPSIPSKPMSATPSPHPATTILYQQVPSGSQPSVWIPPEQEQIMNIRKNPQQTMETLTQLTQHSPPNLGQPQTPVMRQVQTVGNRYPAHVTANAQPYPTHPHHQGYMDGSTEANMSSSYPAAALYPQRMVAPHHGYTHPQPGGHMYTHGQAAYVQPAMTSQQMYGQRGMMMTHPARPVYGGVSGVMQLGPYPSMPQQQQPTASSSLNSSSTSSEEAAVLSPAPSTPLRQQPCAPPPKDDCHDANHSGEAEIATLAKVNDA